MESSSDNGPDPAPDRNPSQNAVKILVHKGTAFRSWLSMAFFCISVA
jgi:hypothetical protein